MFDHESVQIFIGVYMVFAMIVGTVTLVFLIGYTILLPIGRRIGRSIQSHRKHKHEPLEWSQIFDTFDGPTQTLVPPVNFVNEYTHQLPTLDSHHGLAYLAGRPVTADSEKTDFFDMASVMHHQI